MSEIVTIRIEKIPSEVVVSPVFYQPIAVDAPTAPALAPFLQAVSDMGVEVDSIKEKLVSFQTANW